MESATDDLVAEMVDHVKVLLFTFVIWQRVGTGMEGVKSAAIFIDVVFTI